MPALCCQENKTRLMNLIGTIFCASNGGTSWSVIIVINNAFVFIYLPGLPDDSTKPEKTLTVAPSPYTNANESAVLENLEKYTEYYITVLCYTHPGDGKRSQPIKIRTLEDGKLQAIHFLVYFVTTVFIFKIFTVNNNYNLNYSSRSSGKFEV